MTQKKEILADYAKVLRFFETAERIVSGNVITLTSDEGEISDYLLEQVYLVDLQNKPVEAAVEKNGTTLVVTVLGKIKNVRFAGPWFRGTEFTEPLSKNIHLTDQT
ncbi:hypothetical protein KKH43_06540 [Patescibacteria group bacterium]|nr:hypothetical protein [Patescibacteria group bacterium]